MNASRAHPRQATPREIVASDFIVEEVDPHARSHAFEQALLKHPEVFVGTLAEKLLTYASGRGVEYVDAPAIRTIVRKTRPQEFRLSSIVLEIVKSAPFQMRTSS